MASHSGTASPKFKDSWVVGVNVYGNRPSRFMVIKNIIRAVNIRDQLCPLILIGSMSCFVNMLKNQAWVVESRLLSQWSVVLGNSNHGNNRAIVTKEVPNITGLIN